MTTRRMWVWSTDDRSSCWEGPFGGLVITVGVGQADHGDPADTEKKLRGYAISLANAVGAHLG